MFELSGRTVGIMPDMIQAGNYWGQVHQRQQQQWTDNEARRAYSREQDRLRDDASSFQRMLDQQQGAGLFDTQDSLLGSIQRQNVTPIQRPQGAAPAAPGGAPAGAPANPGGSQAIPARPSQSVIVNGQSRSENPAAYDTMRPVPVNPRDLTEAERAAYEQYTAERTARTEFTPGIGVQPIDRSTPEQRADALRRLRLSGLDIVNGQLVRMRPGFSDEVFRSPFPLQQPQSGSTPAPGSPVATVPIPPAGPGAQQPAVPAITRPGVTPPEVDFGAPGPDEEAQDDWFQGVNDTSAPLAPTPQMELISAAVQNALRRAEVNARNGRPDLAEASFAEALVGQARIIQETNMVLYNAARGGSLDATAVLIGRNAGYPRGTFRIAPTDERGTRFVAQRLVNGEWVAASTIPWDRQTMLNGAYQFANAEGAAALSEAAMERYRAEVAANAQIRVAQINAGASLNDNYTDISVAQIGAAGRAAIASGEARLEELSNGDAILMWREFDPATGQMEQRFRQLDRREQQRLDVDGNRTEEVLVASPVTGINNVRPGG